jgi:Domain of unknown function (DUF4826)
MNDPQQAYALWARAALLSMCERLIETDVVGRDALAEVAWTIPHTCLIARIRCPTRPGKDLWATGGDLPVDTVPVEVASGPREAARHFCLRWQLEGARREELGSDAASPQAGESWSRSTASLAEKAERLHGYVRNDALWGAANLGQLAP